MHVDIAAAEPDALRSSRLAFAAWMTGATIIPLLLFLVIIPPNNVSLLGFTSIWFLLQASGQGHVGATIYPYLDRSFHPILREHWLRFLLLPAVLLVALPALCMGSEAAVTCMTYIFVPWNIWHFNRQNVGILNLISKAEGVPAPDASEKFIINGACIAAIVGHYPLQFNTSLTSHLGVDRALQHLSQWSYFAFLAFVVLAIGRLFHPNTRSTTTRTCMFLAFVAAFGAVFLARLLHPGNLAAITTGYSMAHAWQYLLFMGLRSTAGRRGGANPARSRRAGGLGVAATLLCVGAYGIWTMRSGEIARAVTAHTGWPSALRCAIGITYALLAIHYIVDAGAWRLSQRPQREYVAG